MKAGISAFKHPCILAVNRMDTRTLREKKQQQSRDFILTEFNLYTETWMTEKDLEREMKNKGDEFRWRNNIEIL